MCYEAGCQLLSFVVYCVFLHCSWRFCSLFLYQTSKLSLTKIKTFQLLLILVFGNTCFVYTYLYVSWFSLYFYNIIISVISVLYFRLDARFIFIYFLSLFFKNGMTHISSTSGFYSVYKFPLLSLCGPILKYSSVRLASKREKNGYICSQSSNNVVKSDSLF